MSGVFDENTIPIRKHGTEILADWFNTIRQVLLVYIGKGLVAQTQVAVLDNQSTPQDVDTYVFDSTEVRVALLEYEIIRTTKKQWGRIRLYFDGTTWQRETLAQSGQYAGLSFSITSGGQLQYTTDSFSAGTLNIKTISTLAAL